MNDKPRFPLLGHALVIPKTELENGTIGVKSCQAKRSSEKILGSKLNSIAVMARDSMSGKNNPLHGVAPLPSRYLLVMLASDGKNAMGFLLLQPLGTFVLALVENTVCIYFKFAWTVQRIVIACGETATRIIESTEWNSGWNENGNPSVKRNCLHRVYVPSWMFEFLIKCWKKNLPCIRAIYMTAFADLAEMHECVLKDYPQQYVWENEADGKWHNFLLDPKIIDALSIESQKYGLILNSKTLGFYLLCSEATKRDYSSSCLSKRVSYRIRNIEFQLDSSHVAITDGVAVIESSRTFLKFGAKKYMAIKGVQFASLRDSFQNPHQTTLKFVTNPLAALNSIGKHSTASRLAELSNNVSESEEYQAILRLHGGLHDFNSNNQHIEKLNELIEKYLDSVNLSKQPQVDSESECERAEEVIICLVERLVAYYLMREEAPGQHYSKDFGSATSNLMKKCIVEMSLRYATQSSWIQILHCCLCMMSRRKSISAEFVDMIYQLSISSHVFNDKLMTFSGLESLWCIFMVLTDDSVLLETRKSTEKHNLLAEFSCRCIPQPSSRFSQIISLVTDTLQSLKKHTKTQVELKYSLDNICEIDVPLFTQVNFLLMRYGSKDPIASNRLNASKNYIPSEAVLLETAILSFIYRVVTDLLVSVGTSSHLWRSEQCLGLFNLYGRLYIRLQYCASTSESQQTQLIFRILTAFMELHRQYKIILASKSDFRPCGGFQDCLQYFILEWDIFFASLDACKNTDASSVSNVFSLQLYIFNNLPLEIFEEYVKLVFEKMSACTIRCCSLHKLCARKTSTGEYGGLTETFTISLVNLMKLYTCILKRVKGVKLQLQVYHQLSSIGATMPIQYMAETILSATFRVQPQIDHTVDIFCDFLQALLSMMKQCEVSSNVINREICLVDLFYKTCVRGNLSMSGLIDTAKVATSDDIMDAQRSVLRLLGTLYCTFDHGSWKLPTTPLQNVRWHLDRLLCSEAVEGCQLYFSGILAILERRNVYLDGTNVSELDHYVISKSLEYLATKAGGCSAQYDGATNHLEEQKTLFKSLSVPNISWPKNIKNFRGNSTSLSKTTAYVIVLLLSCFLTSRRPDTLSEGDSTSQWDNSALYHSVNVCSLPDARCADIDTIQSHLFTLHQNSKKYILPELLISILEDKDLSTVWRSKQKSKAMRMLLRLMVPDFYPRTLYIQKRLSEKASKWDVPDPPRSYRQSSDEDLEAFESFLNSNEAHRDTQKPQEWMYVAKGAFASVYSSYTPCLNIQVAVKRIPCLRSRQNRSVIPDVFHEIQVLDKLNQYAKGSSLQLLDFGLCTDDEHFEIITEFFPLNLKEWRDFVRNQFPIGSTFTLILCVFSTLCRHLEKIHSAGILHLDIKCENILIRCEDWKTFTDALLQSLKDGNDNWRKYLDRSVVFADFGEALPFVTVPKDDGDNYCEYFGHARGTEAIQSPEMLQHSNERTLKITSASDIWSLGALLYELLGERMLFEQETSASLYTHLVLHKEESCSPREFQTLKPQHIAYLEEYYISRRSISTQEEELLTEMMRLCDFILQRDPRIRPTLSELHDSVDRLIASNLEKTRFVKEPIIPQTLLLQNGEEIDDFCFNDDYAHAIHSNESEVSDVMAITQHWDIRLARKNNGLSCKNWHDQHPAKILEVRVCQKFTQIVITLCGN
ncbi:unnamed protein product [Albugo candida]|uniref:Protein kinase domain-containing protein n=1 Tax=Albugo candida TaxID=65357 RepID=A0A024FY18_9STRA|nr:unnamed protein product [Albugo candida]|eukprot:CCI39474.1 unnamed protein product [Albugo candida]